jgi:hypothetical protein
MVMRRILCFVSSFSKENAEPWTNIIPSRKSVGKDRPVMQIFLISVAAYDANALNSESS